MSQAIIAAVGALFGAAIAAFAAIYGPSRNQRQASRNEASKAELARKEAAIDCFIRLRSASRRWLDELESINDELVAGRTMTVERYDERTKPLALEAEKARDELARYGTWMGSSESSDRKTLSFLTITTRRIRQLIMDPQADNSAEISERVTAYLAFARLSRVQLNEFLFRRLEELHGAPLAEWHGDSAYVEEIRRAIEVQDRATTGGTGAERPAG